MNMRIGLWYILAFLFIGNASAITVPANIVAYIPITFNNYQNSNTVTNSVLAVGVSNTFHGGAYGNTIGVSIIPTNSYYFTSNFNNYEFFYANGTLVNSWFEANTANEMRTGNFPTANNDIWYVKVPWYFIPANTGGTKIGQNTIYLGWAGNVPTTSNTLSNSFYTGYAPQLFQSKGTVNSPQTGYGQYDSGNAVFEVYTGFEGTRLAAGFVANTGQQGAYSVSNGLYLSVVGSTDEDVAGVTTTNKWTYPLITSTLITEVSGTADGASPAVGELTGNAITGSESDNGNWLAPGMFANWYPGETSDFGTDFNECTTVTSCQFYSPGTGFIPGVGHTFELGFLWNKTGLELAYNGFTSQGFVLSNTFSDLAIQNYLPMIEVSDSGNGDSGAFDANWFRAYPYAMNDVMPGTSYGALVTVSSGCTFSISNTMFNFGSLYIGGNLPTQNVINIDNTGTTSSNIFLYGSNWIGTNPPDNFFVTNTVWDWSSGTPFASANQVQPTQTDLRVTLGAGASKNLFLGIGIPNTAVADTYTQIVNVVNLC